MKTKLLKIIRKNYMIYKVTSIGSNQETPYGYVRDWRKNGPMLQLPFYNFKKDQFEARISCNRNFQTFDEAYENMKLEIHNTYFEKFKHMDGRKERVWYK